MSELYIKQEAVKGLSQLDAVVLDVDGVVMDVSRSYRVVIANTVQHYAVTVLGLADTGPVLLQEETELFKLAGGFNDDIDLTNAAVALLVGKHAQTGATDTAAVRAASPGWEEYADEIRRRRGGLPNAEGFLLEWLTAHQRRDFTRGWHPKLVAQLFQEMYAGDEMCRPIYGFAPEHIHGEGYYRHENVLLDASLLPGKRKLGVLTGRNRGETRLALEVAGLLDKVPETAWVTPEDGVRKPDGNTLMLMRDRLDFKNAVYVGDTMDDLRTVHNYRELKGANRARIVSCIVLSGPSGATHRRMFLEAGAEIVAPDVNSFLQYLNSLAR